MGFSPWGTKMVSIHPNICDLQSTQSALKSQSERSVLDSASRQRRRALIIPREHGAWGLLLVPIITGAGVAFRECTHIFPLILLSAAGLALFWLRTPVESLLGTSAMRAESAEECRTVRTLIVVLGVVAALALAALLWAGRNVDLWPLGAAAA